MPLYEYVCLDCRNEFAALRSMAEADSPIRCEACDGQHTARTLSVFFSPSTSAKLTPSNGGGCACGGSCSCAH